MAAYMRYNFPFLGIPKPRRVLLQNEFIKQTKKQKLINWNFIFELYIFKYSEHECVFT